MYLARLSQKKSYGRASGSTYVIGDTEQSYGITYKEISGLLDTYTTPHNSFTYSYDKFDRLRQKLGNRHAISYTYVNGSQRVATYTISQADASNVTYAYTYDNLGNITSVKKNGTTVSVYEYDKLGRLIRENDCANSTAWVYTYDNAGNLLKKYTFYGVANNVPAAHLLIIHPYNGSEISSTYTYSTSDWGDLLTNYNGTTITYDVIGNPLKWRNTSSLTWDKRSLQSMTLSNGTAVSFEYNADGIRTQKTVGTTVHDYILDGSTILKETITSSSGTTTLYYYYDESGISGVSYNGVKYSYIRNLQGDVIGIINDYGVTVVEYNYDAWGNILSVTGSMASTLGAVNPFRYRGYYYDNETGFYYLNSRYYDPQVGRFLNADEPILLGANGGIMGYNLFAYCNNNPMMYSDFSGMVAYRWTPPTPITKKVLAPNSDGRTRLAVSIGNGNSKRLKDIQKKFQFNQTLEKLLGINTQNQYVYYQTTAYKYGNGTSDYNGCGPIAVHNAKLLLGMDSSMPATIERMERLDVTCLNGTWGTNPWKIGKVLASYGIEYSTVELDEMTQEGVYIVSYWNQEILGGAHNVAVYFDGNTYTSYNVYATQGCHPREYIGFVLEIYYLGKPN